jgi:NADP-dependent 3-hydroxy acid dehydrogenase YdfG
MAKWKAEAASRTDGPQSVAGKRILVTGGTTGIGRATVRLLVMRGARVLTFSHHDVEVKKTLKEFGELGEVHGVTADQSRPKDVQRVFREVDKRLGGLDVIVNNAATYVGSVVETDEKAWRKLFDTNILGYVACCKGAIERMQNNPREDVLGHIVNIGSMSADLREEGGELYVATKAAVQGFSESLRKTLNRRGIKVSLIEPGLVGTPLAEMPKRKQREREAKFEILKPDDIAECVFYCITQPKRADVVAVQIRPMMQII